MDDCSFGPLLVEESLSVFDSRPVELLMHYSRCFSSFDDRSCVVTCLQWGTFDLAKLEIVRPEFDGKRRRNEITGTVTRVYDSRLCER